MNIKKSATCFGIREKQSPFYVILLAKRRVCMGVTFISIFVMLDD
jgi:hypothetical protein